MIKIENVEVFGWEAAIRGMRNSWDSHEKSDSGYVPMIAEWGQDRAEQVYEVGDADLALMKRLALAGPSHAKYRRYINVTVDITAPLYWWKEFDTYKIGTVANSESTMHTLVNRPLTLEDFAVDYIKEGDNSIAHFLDIVYHINDLRDEYIVLRDSGDDKYARRTWYQIIQFLPSSFLQKRTVQLNYEVLAHIWKDRKNHKLDEWKEGFCKEFIQTLPYSEGIVWNK